MQENSTDKRAKLYRAISGLIPGGSLIIEYMIDRIPDQRMERLFNFIKEMNSRIEKLENKNCINTEEFALLAENTIIESSKAQSKKRLEWLASISVPLHECTSIMEWEYRMKAVDILSNLSDENVRYLLTHVDWKAKEKYEIDKGQSLFISDGDRMGLSDHELFLKNLSNKRIDLYKRSLLDQGLLIKKESSRNINSILSEFGNMFIYLLTGKYPRLC